MTAPPAAPPPRTTARWRLVAAALLPALFCIWLYWPVRNGGLLADELVLMSYLVEPGVDGPQLDWQRVARDFAGPWAFQYGNYYRPLVTLTMAIDYALGGGAESMFHVTGIALFAACVFSIAVLLGVLFGPAAACLAGLLFAAHPVCHEPICWPCTRADSMVLIACAWACVAFVRYLREGRSRHLVWTHVAVWLALLSKEAGMLLGVWLVLLDFAVRGRCVPLRRRLAPHLGLLPVWLLYLGWRWWILGSPLSGSGPPPSDQLAELWLSTQWAKLMTCFAPAGSRLPDSTPFLLGLLTAWVTAAAFVCRAHRRWLAVAVVWLCVSLLPTQWYQVSPNFDEARILMPALVGFVLLTASALGTSAQRQVRIVTALLVLPAIVALATAVRTIEAAYAHAWLQMAVLRQQVGEAGSRATAAAPLVLMAGLPELDEVPFLPPNMAFAIAERPLARADHAFVSLGYSLEQGVGPPLLEGEVGPWRAMWQQGATLCYWFGPGASGELVLVPGPAAVPPIVLVPSPVGFAVAGGRASPWQIGGVEVLADAAFDGGELCWRTASGDVAQRTIGAARQTPAGWSSVVDLMDDRELLLFGTLSGITGFEVRLSTSAGASVQTLRVLEPPEPAPLTSPLRGASVALAELAERLPWASLPREAEPGSASLVLMNKAFACRVQREGGGALQLPDAARVLFRELDRFSRGDRVYYYLECRVGGRTWRSQVDWFWRS